MKKTLEQLHREADPNCKACKGKGWIFGDDKVADLGGKATVSIGDQVIGEAKNVSFSKKTKRLCPICFDPFGEPRKKDW